MLYRYFSLQKEEHFQWLSDLLVAGKCFFPKAAGFNDPNEFRFQWRTPEDKDVIKATWKRDNPNQTEEDFERWYSTTSFKSWHLYYEPLFQRDLLNMYGVVCFSRSEKNPTMWAHYAANHSGICVGFDESEIKETPGVHFHCDVSYQQSLPVVRYFGEELKDIVHKILFRKHDDWKYEREFRLVADADATLAMNPSLIREVIFGMNIDKPVRDRIQKIIDARQAPIPTRKAHLSYASYELEIT